MLRSCRLGPCEREANGMPLLILRYMRVPFCQIVSNRIPCALRHESPTNRGRWCAGASCDAQPPAESTRPSVLFSNSGLIASPMLALWDLARTSGRYQVSIHLQPTAVLVVHACKELAESTCDSQVGEHENNVGTLGDNLFYITSAAAGKSTAGTV